MTSNQVTANRLIKTRLQALRSMADPPVSGAELDRLTHSVNGRTATIEMRSERGGGISTKTAMGLADIFGATVEYLCGGRGEEPTVETVRAAVARARVEYEAFELAERERLAAEGKSARCPKCANVFLLTVKRLDEAAERDDSAFAIDQLFSVCQRAGSRFVPIERWMMPADARAVLRCLANYRNSQTGECDPGYGAIADETGFSVSTVKRTIRDLVVRDWITVTKRDAPAKARLANGPQLLSNQYALHIRPGDMGRWWPKPGNET